MRFSGSSAVLLASLLLVGASADAGVSSSKHDFRAPGSGPPGALDSGKVCIFCHAPHTDAPSFPLWNRRFGGLAYTPYSSASMQATPGQPTGSSKLCLSCHDGTIAVSELALGDIEIGTSSGAIDLRSIQTITGRSVMKSSSGDINLNIAELNGDLRLESSSGSIQVRRR